MTSSELSTGLLSDPKTFKWIASLRKLPTNLLTSSTSNVSLAERLRIATTMSTLENNIHFDWGSASLRRDCQQSLRDFASLLNRHPHITAKIEGHCGIEVTPQNAQHMTNGRTDAVVRALISLGVDSNRLKGIGMGCDKPLTLEIGPPGEKNRRVEIFLTIDSVEIPDRRNEKEYVKVVKKVITPEQLEIIEEVADALHTHPSHIRQYWEHFQRNNMEMPSDAETFLALFVQDGDDDGDDGDDGNDGDDDDIIFMTEEEAAQLDHEQMAEQEIEDDEDEEEDFVHSVDRTS